MSAAPLKRLKQEQHTHPHTRHGHERAEEHRVRPEGEEEERAGDERIAGRGARAAALCRAAAMARFRQFQVPSLDSPAFLRSKGRGGHVLLEGVCACVEPAGLRLGCATAAHVARSLALVKMRRPCHCQASSDAIFAALTGYSHSSRPFRSSRRPSTSTYTDSHPASHDRIHSFNFLVAHPTTKAARNRADYIVIYEYNSLQKALQIACTTKEEDVKTITTERTSSESNQEDRDDT